MTRCIIIFSLLLFGCSSVKPGVYLELKPTPPMDWQLVLQEDGQARFETVKYFQGYPDDGSGIPSFGKTRSLESMPYKWIKHSDNVVLLISEEDQKSYRIKIENNEFEEISKLPRSMKRIEK